MPEKLEPTLEQVTFTRFQLETGLSKTLQNQFYVMQMVIK